LWHVQEMLWDDLTLCVARLTDPLETARQRNLTIKLLPRLPEVFNNLELRSQVKKTVASAVESAQSCREYSNKKLGHTDLKLEMESAKARRLKSELQRLRLGFRGCMVVSGEVDVTRAYMHVGRDEGSKINAL